MLETTEQGTDSSLLQCYLGGVVDGTRTRALRRDRPGITGSLQPSLARNGHRSSKSGAAGSSPAGRANALRALATPRRWASSRWLRSPSGRGPTCRSRSRPRPAHFACRLRVQVGFGGEYLVKRALTSDGSTYVTRHPRALRLRASMKDLTQ